MIQPTTQVVSGDYCDLGGEQFFRIANVQKMDEFFLSIVSAFDHWMFITSRGALTAGRKNSSKSLFPYYCADKIIDGSSSTGSLTIVRIQRPDGQFVYWSPMAGPADPESRVSRSLYRNVSGSKIIFEEINHDLELTYRYSWTFSQQFGFVRESCLSNNAVLPQSCTLLDGIQNILPASIDPTFQMRFSNLGDAYKKSERFERTDLGIYYLSSIPSDRAEPNEGLRANVVWSIGLEAGGLLLSSRQVDKFRLGGSVQPESDIRGSRGAYLKIANLDLPAEGEQQWKIVANLDLDQTDVVNFNQWKQATANLNAEVEADVKACDEQLRRYIASSDGLQAGADKRELVRHQSNVLYNVMRGGLPVAGYQISKDDFIAHVEASNREVYRRNQEFLNHLGESIENRDLERLVAEQDDPGLLRICFEYLPLTFSRRHGDPTRPWNEFSIDVLDETGRQKLFYQGNWRDIFQNWEALSVSYPEFAPKMVSRFLNASTADGYNPYRITKNGFEWEKLDPNDPWSNIGYWGDHQIVYLQRLLERCREYLPEEMNGWLTKECFSFANVPYRIKKYADVLVDPRDTIVFDESLDREISEQVKLNGEDGKLLQSDGQICHASLLEKLLIPSLAKMFNLVPGGGIWLNTQRPEWNDANNALVGNGLSVVTACDLRKYICFLREWISTMDCPAFVLSVEVSTVLRNQMSVLFSHVSQLESGWNSKSRRNFVDELSELGDEYREGIYSKGFSGEKTPFRYDDLIDLFALYLRYLDDTILSNQRSDGLYHSYNVLAFGEGTLSINQLFEMLEGQVAVLNSGLLGPEDALLVLDALRGSAMYRADQNSYMLYPDRDLPRFTEKNQIPAELVRQSKLISRLIESGDESIVRKDGLGDVHFNGDIRNASVLTERLKVVEALSDWGDLVASERKELLRLFEAVFDHKSFTGRSGTFFAYEGLGSIYWHMVSKLKLAVVGYLGDAHAAASSGDHERNILDRLRVHYDNICNGIGVGKTPEHYGAIPTDPYSHTPKHAGAQQPGMTGQVKEDILSRFYELGLRIADGVVSFDPALMRTSELLNENSCFQYLNVDCNWINLPLCFDQFAFTVCQVPVIYKNGDASELTIVTREGDTTRSELRLSATESSHLFSRDSFVERIEITFPFNK
jgi:hypothetical protein